MFMQMSSVCQKLLTAVNRCGERWVKVAKYIPGRNHNQCRER